MSLTLTTDYKGVKVIRKDKVSQNGNPYTQFSLMTTSKKNDEFITGFIDCAFKKADVEKINNKAIIKIKNAFPTVDEYNGKKNIRWMITEFEILEEGEKRVQQEATSSDGFMNIDADIDTEEVPFN